MAGATGKRVKKWIALTLLLAVAAGGLAAYTFRSEISDYVLASSFEPDARVTQLRTEIDLTETGDRVFLASQPTVGGREEFNRWCAKVDHSEKGHVLGCFADKRIRLFEVNDERLSGVVETTAAHELLHAVFARMSEQDRDTISTLLQAEYEKLSKSDPALRERMAVYKNLSPARFANELHSVLGTEMAELSQKLEDHYSRWFAKREKVVALYESYHSVFTELTAEAERLSSELDRMREDIKTRSLNYDTDVKRFNEDVSNFRARNERYEFSGKPQEFNQIRADLTARQQTLEETLQGIQADTDRFNELREQLLKLNGISVELNEVLDSNLPGPTETPTKEE